MKVPIVKLQLDEGVISAAVEVLRSGMWIEGRHVRDLEKKFATYTGVKHARGVNSGTAALLCALHALGIKQGDEVILPSFTFIASVNTVLRFGATPVFADVNRDTFNLSVDDVRKKITGKTAAIMPVHLYGLPVDMDPLVEISEKKNIAIVEDACQAHGAAYKGKKCGAIGAVGAFSLYPTKNMYCGGEGGIITTNDAEILEKVNLFANHGQSAKYVHSAIGFNYRLQDVNGLIALDSLAHLDENNKKRRKNASFYNDALGEIGDIEIPVEPEGYHHVYHQYTLKVKRRDELAAFLGKNDIGYGIHYGTPAHSQESIKALGLGSCHLPVTEALAKEVISLPAHPCLSSEQLQFVVDKIKEFYT